MPQCIVIADDLTGANATGVLMAKMNYRTYTVMNEERLNMDGLADCDCVVYPTDSRSIAPELAYNRVFNAASILKSPDAKVYSKRIDSTLRGNLGYETDALLDALGNESAAIIVPCFPSSGRVTVGGYLLVKALPLHRTEVIFDPKNPVHTPLCAEIFQQQSKYPVGSIQLRDLMKGLDFVSQKICSLVEQGMRNIVFDAVTQEDIDLIADAVILSGVAFIAVDPGVFTATITRKLVVPIQTRSSRRVLAAVGSVNAVAGRQAELFLASQTVWNVYMETAEFLEGEDRRMAEIGRVVSEILDNCEDYEVCSVIGHGILPEYRVPFEPYASRYNCTFDDLSNLINESVAEIVYRIIAAGRGFSGLYTSGGDITVAVCRRMKNVGLRLLSEVLPLAAYGELMGGDYSGLKIVTKGGMVGEADAMVSCVGYLKEKLSI